MDYIEKKTVERLYNVVKGDQTGISEEVSWQGGGSFIYCELKEDGQTLIDEIQTATFDTISMIKEEIYHDDRIIPYITIAELEKADKKFKEMTLEEKKKALIKLVDKNKLYINCADMLDKLSALFGVPISMFEDAESTVKPFAFALRASEITEEDLEAVSAINRIALNCNFMTQLLEGDHANE